MTDKLSLTDSEEPLASLQNKNNRRTALKIDPFFKIAASVAFVVVGTALAIIAGTGVVPYGDPQPSLSEPLRAPFCLLGILMILFGAFCTWIVIFRGEPGSPPYRKKHEKKLAEGIASILRTEPGWAAEALGRAKIKPRGESVFLDRMGHFYDEKEALAENFTSLLIERCHLLTQSNKKVFLLIDSGTTLYPFFERLGLQLARRKAQGQEWIDKLRIVSNNLAGIETLMNEGRINSKDPHSPLAVTCHLLPGEPLPIYSAVTGDVTNKALTSLRKREGPQARFIALTTGNWIRLRRSQPTCPIPLARGKGHFEFKQKLFNISDEVYVVAPLGKVFIHASNDEVNRVLGFAQDATGQEKSYREVKILGKKPAVTKLISTYRPPDFLLTTHATRLCALLDIDQNEPFEILREKFRKTKEIHDIPHILFKFNELSDNLWLQFITEFPHEHTRHEEFVRRFFGVQSIPAAV